jgi:aspartate-semialdehyde dehydrogenase
MKKISVGILGATGSVGQKFIELLGSHPWLEITSLAASSRSVGKTYQEATNWFMTTSIPEHVRNMRISTCEPNLPCKIVFSGLDAKIAGEIEEKFAKAGYIVVSNSRNHRFDQDVPLVIPEINPNHLELIKSQKYGKGCIVTNPNCSTIGLVIALKPLLDKFGLDSVAVTTLQALSGGGYSGVSSVAILDNVLPYIADEEEKMQVEPLKILGQLGQGKINYLEGLKISAQCNRVPVLDGHLECVSVKLKNKASKEEIIKAWRDFKGLPQKLNLPMAPKAPIHYFDDPNLPQPKLQRNLDKGMAVSIGRLRECPVLDYKFTLLSHNTIRGAAGGAILNAEMLLAHNHLPGV